MESLIEEVARVSKDIFDTIEFICQAFGLSNEDFARVCRTSEDEIESIIDGKNKLSSKLRRRLFSLTAASYWWIRFEFPDDRENLDRKVIGELSVFEMLCEKEIDTEKILFSGVRICVKYGDNDD